MGVRLLHFEGRSPLEVDAAFAAMMREHTQAVIIAPDPFFRQQGRQLAELAERRRAVDPRNRFAEAGATGKTMSSITAAPRPT
jgi:hypothetical protein